MPKRKPDKVIEYRFSLQDKERQMLDSYVAAHSFNSITTPIVTLMNDVTGMIVFLSLLASLLGFTFLTGMLGTDPKMSDVIDAFLDQREQAIAAGLLTVGLVGTPLGPAWGLRLARLLGLLPEQES